MNIHEENIQFTIEKEVHRVLHFLDLSIKKDKDCFITKVYKKTAHTFTYYHWRSNHSERTLLGVMKTLNHRGYRLCDREEDMKVELGFLRDIFIANCDPVKKLDQVFETYKADIDEREIQRMRISLFQCLFHMYRGFLRSFKLS